MKKKNSFTLLFVLLTMFVFISCSSVLGGRSTNDDATEEPKTADQLLREETAGSYFIACYNSGGETNFEHLITFTSGDISGGSYTHIQRQYSDADCANLLFEVTLESTFNYGGVEAIDGDSNFSDDIMLDSALVEAPRMNVTVAATKLIVHDEASIPMLESFYGITVPGLEVEVSIPGETTTYYTHVYFDDENDITVAIFMSEATDYRATFVDDGYIVAVKQ